MRRLRSGNYTYRGWVICKLKTGWRINVSYNDPREFNSLSQAKAWIDAQGDSK